MRLHALFLVVVWIAGAVYAWRSFKVLFTKFPYEINKEFVEVKVEILNETGETGETTINAHVSVLEEMDDLSLTYGLSLEASEGNFTTLVNRTLNFCKFLKTRSTEPFFKVIYEDLLKHGNFFKSCPIKKGVYYIHDFRIDEEMLPSYVPETNFIFDIAWTMPHKAQAIFKGKLHGKIDKSKGFNNLKIFSLG